MRNRNCQEDWERDDKREGRAAVNEYVIYLLQQCSPREEGGKRRFEDLRMFICRNASADG